MKRISSNYHCLGTDECVKSNTPEEMRCIEIKVKEALPVVTLLCQECKCYRHLQKAKFILILNLDGLPFPFVVLLVEIMNERFSDV
jgi:hypothetical protein